MASLVDRVEALEAQMEHVGHCMDSACKTFQAMVEHYNLNGDYMVADKCKTCMSHMKADMYQHEVFK